KLGTFYDDDARCYASDRPDQYADLRSWCCALTGLASRNIWLAYRPAAKQLDGLVGLGGLRALGEPDTLEIFCVVDPSLRDRGIGTEILRLVIGEGHRLAHRIEARVDTQNSRAVTMCIAAGMLIEGTQRGLVFE